MIFCPCCGKSLPDDRDRVGARCPYCHDPLYEPPTRIARPARPDEPVCANHPNRESVGPCARCAQHVCETCRTRWRGLVLCMNCVGKALETAEATPAMAASARRQTLLALVLGLGGWLGAALGLALLSLATHSRGDSAPSYTLFAVMAIVLACLPAALGAGQALAALRGQTEQPALAWVGFGLGAVYTGLILGLGILGMWQP